MGHSRETGIPGERSLLIGGECANLTPRLPKISPQCKFNDARCVAKATQPEAARAWRIFDMGKWTRRDLVKAGLAASAAVMTGNDLLAEPRESLHALPTGRNGFGGVILIEQ
jgi:hypothetical protein